ncbi:MAG TPA: ATP-dependent DNA helicase RecG [Vulgatibacter sp.]|nr:ATP-dependent DNA helicase RecG [Vulgatibacter sp.]
MDAATILAELFGPLRFATRDDFARAGNLRGVGRLAESVVRRAGEAGADPTALERIRQAAAAFDAAGPAGKAASARALLAALGAAVRLPEDLAAVMGGEAAGPGREGDAIHPRGAAAGARPVVGDDSSPGPRGPAGAEARSDSGGAPRPAPRRQPRAAARRAAPEAEAPEPESAGRSRVPVPAFAAAIDTPLESLRGVGPQLAAGLAKKGITTFAHVLYHLPRAWQDRRRVATIRELVPGEKGLTRGEVLECREIFNPRSRKRMLRVLLGDPTGRLTLTFFHYWPSTSRRFQKGRRFFAWGDVKLFGGQKQIVHPELEEEDPDAAGAGRIVPVYRGMDEVGQGRYRGIVERVLDEALDRIPEILPEALRRERRLVGEAEALRALHRPPSSADVEALAAGLSPWHRRLAYEEFLVLSIGLALKARGIQVEPGHRFDTSPARLEEALAILPFTPTGAQRRAIEAIAADLAQPFPMNRLLQGDVGSGKTAVALVACLLAIMDGRQAALMAPTELLAEQHHRGISKLLEGTGIEIALLATGRGQKALAAARERVASGAARLAIGTHALFSEGSAFQDLGLVVIDEQHRFGVEQRADLISKGVRPDVLVMTATPIPRTLALVLHGELSQTVIDELPPGRTPVVTKVVGAKGREKVWNAIEAQLAQGRQAYVVYPLIEESERSDLEDATRGLATLRERFPGRRLDLVHGRMKAEERDAVMEAFRAGKVDVLVSTTVVEVGVDVPNATAMVIEHAERFGLSQLHQLRGRVGRGAARSYCYLIDHGGEGRSRSRLAVMERTTDGFEIARADLEIRGPGEFLGTRQAGVAELAFGDLARDARLLEQAREDAFALVRADPDLSRPEHRLLEREVFARFATRMSLAQVG